MSASCDSINLSASSRRCGQEFSPSLAVPYRMLKVITRIGLGCSHKNRGGGREQHKRTPILSCGLQAREMRMFAHVSSSL